MIDDMVRFNFDRDLKLAMPEGNNSMNGKFFFYNSVILPHTPDICSGIITTSLL